MKIDTTNQILFFSIVFSYNKDPINRNNDQEELSLNKNAFTEIAVTQMIENASNSLNILKNFIIDNLYGVIIIMGSAKKRINDDLDETISQDAKSCLEKLDSFDVQLQSLLQIITEISKILFNNKTKANFVSNNQLDSKINELAKSLAGFLPEKLNEVQEMCKSWVEDVAKEISQFIEANSKPDSHNETIKEKIKPLETLSAEILSPESNTMDFQSKEEKAVYLLSDKRISFSYEEAAYIRQLNSLRRILGKLFQIDVNEFSEEERETFQKNQTKYDDFSKQIYPLFYYFWTSYESTKSSESCNPFDYLKLDLKEFQSLSDYFKSEFVKIFEKKLSSFQKNVDCLMFYANENQNLIIQN